MNGLEDLARTWLGTLLQWIAIPVLVYFLVINSSYLMLVLLSIGEFRKHLRFLPFAGREQLLGSRVTPGVSVIASVYNEEAGIEASARSMLSLHYPSHEVILVDDGSKDDTFEVLRRTFDLVQVDLPMPERLSIREHPTGVFVPRSGHVRLTVVRKPNSGRSDSMNVGINLAREDLVVFVDGDSLLDPDALLAVAQPFVDDPVHTVAAGGVIRAANGCRVEAGRVVSVGMPPQLVSRIQVVEYLRAFHLGRSGWSRLRALILISGAFGIFRRDVLLEVGGLDPTSIGEDFELVMRIHQHMRRQRRRYRVTYVTEPICWTEVPTSLSVLRRQRKRWHRGLWETLWAYRHMFLNPRYGRVGMVAVPYYWFFELLAPVIELGGMVLMILGAILGLIDGSYLLLLLAVAYGYGALVTLAALAVEEFSYHKYGSWRDLGSTLVAAVVENVGYRLLTAWWRIEGWWASLTGRKAVWGEMTRTGFGSGSPTP